MLLQQVLREAAGGPCASLHCRNAVWLCTGWGGGPRVHPATLVGWMSQLHHSNSGRLRMLIFPSQIQQHSGLSSFLIGQAKMGLMLTRRKKTRGARSTDVDLVFEGLLSDCL